MDLGPDSRSDLGGKRPGSVSGSDDWNADFHWKNFEANGFGKDSVRDWMKSASALDDLRFEVAGRLLDATAEQSPWMVSIC